MTLPLRGDDPLGGFLFIRFRAEKGGAVDIDPARLPQKPPQEYGPTRFKVGVQLWDRSVYAAARRETEWANMSRQVWLVLRLGWPPVRYFNGFIVED